MQYSSILPPDEKAIVLQPNFLAESSTERVSTVFPEMVVVTTRVLESTVLGR